MTEPDELYTLRAQYWMGHYDLALEEARSIARAPMPPHLKVEREEFVLRCLLAKGDCDKVLTIADAGDAKCSGIKALGIRARFEKATTQPARDEALASLQSLLADTSTSTPSTRLTAAHVYLAQGNMNSNALEMVHSGDTLEHLAISVQIHLSIDRPDLAREILGLMKSRDEEAVPTQIAACHVYCHAGKSESAEAVHIVRALSEQYGPSPMLLNMTAVGLAVSENYEAAAMCLAEAAAAEGTTPGADTLVNAAAISRQKAASGSEVEMNAAVSSMRAAYPEHSFVKGLDRFEVAFERESMKYVVRS